VKSPVFMRVPRNVPHLTIIFSIANVNGFYGVSTGFLRVFSVFVRFGAQNWRFLGIFGQWRDAE